MTPEVGLHFHAFCNALATNISVAKGPMISQGSAPGRTVRADFHTLAERRQQAWDAWGVSSDSDQSSQQAMTLGAIELLAFCASSGLVLLGVWLFRWAVLSPAVWGVLSPVLAAVVSITLMGGLVWVGRMDTPSRSAVSAMRRAARRARRARGNHKAVLSQAITTADALALTTGGIWLDTIDKRSDS